MSTLNRELRKKLATVVAEARTLAEKAATKALQGLAVGERAAHRSMTDDQKSLRNRLAAHGRQLGDRRNVEKGTQQIEHLVSECAYEHWHRMLFARCLAENDLLIEPQSGVAISIDEVKELARVRGSNWVTLAGEFAVRMLPQVFRQDDPVLEVQLAPEDRKRMEELLNVLPGEVFTASDSLGWTYQFWQAERKDAINASGTKIGADELPAVTQLFTEDYMVDFLLDNTLGAWHAGKVLNANPRLAETAKSENELRLAVSLSGCPWNYLRFKQGADDKWTPAAGTFEGWPNAAKDLRCLDPCMGSGHFVVAMFERLLAVRMAEEKSSVEDSVVAVIRENLFGLEIDPRCTQIAAFNLALAAWRRAGHCPLPPMNLACSGLAPNTREADWLSIAGGNEKLKNGMARLYRLFTDAPVLGSLINPSAVKGDLLEAAFHELQPLLEKALARETQDDAVHEMAVTARGLAKAAEILAGRFTLVATNVPYLKSGNQVEILKEFCRNTFAAAKSDLATCFIQRCIGFAGANGSVALVTPQSWLYQPAYTVMRRQLLEDYQWNCLAKLGPRAFETITGEVVNVSLVCVSTRSPASDSLCGIEASEEPTAGAKASGLVKLPLLKVKQSDQLKNPEHRIVISGASNGKLLADLAESYKGITSNDDPQFFSDFWEQAAVKNGWEFLQSTVRKTQLLGGLESLVLYEGGYGRLRALALAQDRDRRQDFRGVHAWGKPGVAVSCTGTLPVSLYSGHKFDTNAAVIVPNDAKNLLAIWAFCSSPRFNEEVRKIDQSLKVTNATLVKVPFDLAHWEKVAAEKYPHGLPKPFSSDPTQWLFNGHPDGADQPLHVAVARLLGYQWPRQTGSNFPDCPTLGADGLEAHADTDGIVSLMSLKGEEAAAERLRKLLAAAYRREWSATKQPELLAKIGFAGKSLDDWLRDGFFEQHCVLFHHCPFVWHLWDGERDGFHALVNYHRLAAPGSAGRKTLEKLTYAYLGDWISRQKAEQKQGKEGADAKLASALHLQEQLKMIIQGEPPYDLFVRWKALHEQAIGWEPDINNGVKLNIRPFMMARTRTGKSIFRKAPKMKWEKDRGKEPERSKQDFPWFWGWDQKSEDFTGGREFDGNRWNDLHYTNELKREAQARQKGSQR